MAKMKFSEVSKELTTAELEELEQAEKREIVFDEDSPEMTPEMLLQFKRVSATKRKKETVSIRVSPKTLEKAKILGKGYTSFLSRLLDEAINNEEMVRKCI